MIVLLPKILKMYLYLPCIKPGFSIRFYESSSYPKIVTSRATGLRIEIHLLRIFFDLNYFCKTFKTLGNSRKIEGERAREREYTPVWNCYFLMAFRTYGHALWFQI